MLPLDIFTKAITAACENDRSCKMVSGPLENRLQTVSFGIILPPPGTGVSERSEDRNPQEFDYCSDVAFHRMIHTLLIWAS